MKIFVDVSAYYRWDILPAGEAPLPGDVVVQTEFAGETRTAVRRLVEEPSVTEIEVPDESLDTMHADHQEAGGQMGRHQFLARHLEDAVMAHHAPSAHWQGVRADDPEAHEHLQHWIAQFGGGSTTPAPAPPPPAPAPEPLDTGASA